MDLREVWFPLHLIGAAFWWDQLCAGDHSAFDAWMTAVGATNPADDIPYDDVLGSAELDLAPNRAVNARVFLSERNIFPGDIPGMRLSMRQKDRDGNSHAVLADLVLLCEAYGVWYAVKNPDTSWLWRQQR